MKIGTPRPPKKEGSIKFQYGRLDGEYDYLILYGDNVPKCDRALVLNQFTSKQMSFDWGKNKPIFNDSFIDELEKRGYDTKTIKFSIDRKLVDDKSRS